MTKKSKTVTSQPVDSNEQPDSFERKIATEDNTGEDISEEIGCVSPPGSDSSEDSGYDETEQTTTIYSNQPQEFATDILDLLEDGDYVDKTKHLMWLLAGGRRVIVLRPRRFGKTLTLSTLEAIFSSKNKEKFINTAICKKFLSDPFGRLINNRGKIINPSPDNESIGVKYDWKNYPVLRMDFIQIIGKTPEITEKKLNKKMSITANTYKVLKQYKEEATTQDIGLNMMILFDLLLHLDGYQRKVVVLIDEYDSVFQDYRYQGDKLKEKQRHIDIVIQFYRSLKEQNHNIHLLFMTGITNLFFTKEISPITGWNDYSLKPETAELVGFTEEEIKNSYSENQFKKIYMTIDNDQSNTQVDIKTMKEEVIKELKFRYDGYRFTRKPIHVFNSEAIVNCFQSETIDNVCSDKLTTEYQWGELQKTPRVYEKLIKENKFKNIAKGVLIGNKGSLEDKNDQCISFLYQTGLLTIDKAKKGGTIFNLKIPNMEVKTILNREIRNAFTKEAIYKAEKRKTRLIDALESDDWGSFFTYLRSSLKVKFNTFELSEINCTNTMRSALDAIGILDVDVELLWEGNFRTDVSFIHRKKVYIIENKLLQEPYKNMKRDDGFDQVISKYYGPVKDKYKHLPIYLIGINLQKKPKIIKEDKKAKIRKTIIEAAENTLGEQDMVDLKTEVDEWLVNKTKNWNSLENKLVSFFPNISTIDNFYMKRVDNVEKTVSHLEGHYSEEKAFEIKSEDSYPRNRTNRYLTSLTDAPEILYKKPEDWAVTKEQDKKQK